MFLSKIKASSDDRSAWGDFWFQPLGALSGTGVRVDSDSALRLSTVYACVRVLCESMAILPFRIYRRKAGGGRVLVTDHWLYRLFAKRPNQFQTPFEFIEMLQGHLSLRGNAFCEIVDDSQGGIGVLLPLHPDRMRIDLLDNGSWRYRFTDRNGTEVLYRRDQIWHLRGLSSDGIVGLNPIELQREAIASGLGAQEYGNRFFANDAQPSGGWIEHPGRFADHDSKKKFRDSWQQMQGGTNRGKTAVLENGMKYHQIGINNRDSQFIESKGFNVSEIARIFRVPPHLIGDLTKATFSNIEQQSLDFVTHTMTPWAERWESSIETFLLGTDDGPNQDYEVEFDFSILLRADASARSTYYHNGIQDGWLVRNEARQREGLDPLPGLDEPLRPLNMVEESDAEETEQLTRVVDDSKQSAPKDSSVDARFKAVLTANAGRLARRIIKSVMLDESFAVQIAEGLGITRGAAVDWMRCESPTSPENWNEKYIAASLLRYAGVEP
jgi:HK97 family phage portal protein